ncbi:MAG: hypothetical protein H0T42_26875 [Deltaproteobacteria bacterium]|nr:hypothetical protein [Deltaproteobacteria bacterium]
MMQFLEVAQASSGRAPDELRVFALIKGCEAVGTRAIRRKEHASLLQAAPAMARLILDAFR